MSLRPATRRCARLLTFVVLAISLAACASGATGTATVTNGALELSAQGADFNVATVEAKPGEAFTVHFSNHDPVSHNFAVYSSEGGDLIVRGDPIEGPDTKTDVRVPALDAGTYFFRCDAHPDHMKGVLVVGD